MNKLIELAKRYGAIVLCIIILLLWTISCVNNKRQSARIDRNLKALQEDSISVRNVLKKLQSDNKALTYEKSALEVTEKELRKQVWVKDDKLKVLTKTLDRLNTVVRVGTETRIDTISIPYAVEVPCDFDRTDTIKKPNYGFVLTTNEKGSTVSDLSFSTELDLLSGFKRKNIFSPYQATISVTPNNEFVKITKIEGQVVTIEKTIWDSPIFWLVGGAVLGSAGILLIQ